MVHVVQDVRGVEQHHEVLGEVGEGVDAEPLVGEQHRPCLGHPEGGAHDRHVDVLQSVRVSHGGDVAVAAHFRHGRAHHPGPPAQVLDGPQRILRGPCLGELAAHQLQPVAETGDAVVLIAVVEQRHGR